MGVKRLKKKKKKNEEKKRAGGRGGGGRTDLVSGVKAARTGRTPGSEVLARVSAGRLFQSTIIIILLLPNIGPGSLYVCT